MLKQKSEEKFGANQEIRCKVSRMKKARTEIDTVEIGEPMDIPIPIVEEKVSEPTVNNTTRTPEYIPPATFSSPESADSPSVMPHAAIEIKTIDTTRQCP